MNAAMLLFWRKGFSATSLADLTAAMGISPPSLYAAFGSKEALYEEALHHYAKTHGERAWERFNKASTAREAMTAYLLDSESLRGIMAGSGDPPGCMLALSSVGEEGNATLGAIVRNARARTLRRLEDRLARAVREGELSARQAEGLARFFLAVQGGMSLQARDGATREELEEIVRQATRIFDADRE